MKQGVFRVMLLLLGITAGFGGYALPYPMALSRTRYPLRNSTASLLSSPGSSPVIPRSSTFI